MNAWLSQNSHSSANVAPSQRPMVTVSRLKFRLSSRRLDEPRSLPPRIVIKPLVDNLAVSPFRNGHLLHVNRLSVRRDEIHRRFIKRHVVADAGRHDVEPFPFFHAIQELFSRSMLALTPSSVNSRCLA